MAGRVCGAPALRQRPCPARARPGPPKSITHAAADSSRTATGIQCAGSRFLGPRAAGPTGDDRAQPCVGTLPLRGKLLSTVNVVLVLPPTTPVAFLPTHRHAGPVARHILRWRPWLCALMHLCIHPLYVLVSNILSSIFNFFTLIHPLYHPLSTVGPTCHFI
jgi:hypothetical protein